MLGEKSAEHIARLALRNMGHGTEEILGWDSGAGTITNQGKRWTGKLLLIATPLHVCLYAVHEGPMSVVDWGAILATDTRQGKWKSEFILHLNIGASVSLRTAAPRPVQTLISDWVRAQKEDEGRFAQQREAGLITTEDKAGLAADIARRFQAGEIEYEPSWHVEDSTVDKNSLPGKPVVEWRR